MIRSILTHRRRGSRKWFLCLLALSLTLVALLSIIRGRAFSPMPLGNYANTSVQLGGNTTVTPDAAPTATTSINVSTSTNFKGKLEGNPTTGVVRVTDAHPAGTYTVTVTAFDGGPSTKTFTLTVTTPATCNPVTFADAVNFGTGSAPDSVAVGDFNGDGKQDLVTANANAANVSVLLGNGAGSFNLATNFGVGIGPRSVAVGDFNGDGKQDLATANGSANNVSVLLGNGAGSFNAATNFLAGANPFFVAVGDFNADGKQDLAIANQNSRNVSVLLGSGAGGFANANNFDVGTNPRSVAVSDFNGDGKQDLATANQVSGNVSVLMGNGAGGFGTATNFVAGPNPQSVAMGDFNGDGKQDLAVANLDANVSILLGNGTGGFSAATSFGAGTNPSAVEVGDFNDDGKQDLAVTNFNSGNVSVLLGNGEGSFSAATNFGVGTSPFSVAAGDFNSDGNLDLAVTNFGSANVSVLLRQCVVLPTLSISDVSVAEGNSGTVNAVFTVSLSPASGQTVTVNYATADGTATSGSDYQGIGVTALTFTPGQTSKSVTVLLNGDTANEPNESFFVNLSGATNSNITDSQGQGTILNDDALPTLSINDVSVVEGNSGTVNAVFTVSLSPASGQTVTMNFATADGTATAGGDYQAISATTLTFNPGEISKPITVSVIGDTLNEANETFFINLSSPTNATITDSQGVGTIINDDPPPTGNLKISGRIVDNSAVGLGGVLIILSGAASGSTATDGTGNYSFANLSAGDYTVAPSSGNYSFSPANQTFNNLNVDRIANFVGTQTIVNITGQVTDSNNAGVNNVGVVLTKNGLAAGTVQTDGLGNYSFGNLAAGASYMVTPAGSFTPSSQTFSNLALNAVANFKAAPSIPPQCSTASFGAATNVAAGAFPRSVAIGDFNVDGKLDLALANRNSSNVSILLGSGTGSFGAATNFAVGSSPSSVAIGDFNTDGKSDLAVANGNSANVSILLGSGTGSFSAATNFAVGSVPDFVAIGDFNGDGKRDLATANFNSDNVSILLGSGTGSFSVANNFAVGSGPDSVAIGDFNGDGKSDLATANQNSANVSIVLGSGTGSFGAATNLAVGSFPRSVAIGDFNGDGKSDLAMAIQGSNNVAILLGSGTGSFSPVTNFAVGSGPGSIAIGDFNGDGKSDLAVANEGSDNVSILLGSSTGSFGAATNFAVGSVPASVAVGDFNGDGKSDLATANNNSNNVSILINNGATCNTQTSLTISGRVPGPNNSPLSDVTVTLSGPITRVIQSDINGNYSFPNLAPGGNYAVTVQSPYFIFAPSRADFFNLSSSQTANFTAAPVAVPSPTPPLSDDFTSPTRDPSKWNLGALTQPAAAFDPQVTTAQVNGQLVITPLNQASGLHYNGYVSANSFNFSNGTVGVEVVEAATGGANTIFAIGPDSNNFFGFMVHTAGRTSGVTVKGVDGLEAQLDITTPELLLQVMIAGQLTTLNIPYDSVKHRFMRFRHTTQVSPPFGAILFEAGPDDHNYTVLRRTLIRSKPLDPMTIALSAGTTGATDASPTVFDNVQLILSTFQFSSGTYSAGEGDTFFLVTVTRAGDTTTEGMVDFETVDGSASQGSKYLKAAGRLTFAVGETSKNFSVSIVDTNLAEGNQTLDLLLGKPVGAGLNSPGRALLNIVDNDTLLTPMWQPITLANSQVEIKTWTTGGKTFAYLKLLFPDAGYRVASWGQPVGAFSADAVVERFTGASVQAVKTTAQIYDLGVLAPGNYSFTFKNSGTVVKTQAFTVGSPPFPVNPIDDQRQFVRRQYLDFLNREPDGPGWDFWTDNITKCSDPNRRPSGQTEAECTSRQRETTSAAFFISPEFQNTGYFVLRVYRGSLNRMPFFGGSVPPDPNKDEFTRDHATVSAGIVVNNQLDAGVINANKQAFVNQFVTRAEFRAIYDGLNNQQYVDKLIETTGVPTTPERQQERQQLIDGLNAPTPTETRASVLFKIVDGTQTGPGGGLTFQTRYGQAFYDQQFKPAFVQMEYFGYMKRDPDDLGYAFWLDKLNSFPSFVEAQMVLAFISSPEYRARFGQP